MSNELNKELARIVLAQAPDDFRRDHYLVPTNIYQLERINRIIKELPLSKNKAE